ncbi:MAG: hypothetical protein IJ696_03525 [Ruminococcus sp.]|nr:hypothetical protein [Ruminococcus sp.]
MQIKKLLSSAVAALVAVSLTVPMTALAVPIATESQAQADDPAQTEDNITDVEPEEPDDTEDPAETDDPEEPAQTEDVTTEKQTKKTTKETEKKTTTEETTTKKTTTKQTTTTKKTTRKKTTTTEATTQETEPVTTTQEETTTTTEEEGEDKESFYSANVDVTTTGFDDDGEIDVKLKIDSDSKIAGAKIFLDFDEAVFEYKKSKSNDDNIGGIVTDSCEDGRYRFEYLNTSGTEYDGTFVTVTFKLKKRVTVDQTSVMAVVDSLNDEELNDITNVTVSNAIITVEQPDDSDDEDKEKVAPDNERTYQPINLTLADKDGVTLDSLGIKDYESIDVHDESIAVVEDGMIKVLTDGVTEMDVTYKDGTKGYYRINVMDNGDEVSSLEDSSEAAGTLSSDEKNNDTAKLTFIIVIVCVLLVALIIAYFVLVVKRKKKEKEEQRKKQSRREKYYNPKTPSFTDRDNDFEDFSFDDDSDMKQFDIPAAPVINEPEDNDEGYQDEYSDDGYQDDNGDDAYDEQEEYSYKEPANNAAVNDFENFLDRDGDEDIKFTAPGKQKARPSVKNDIEDFKLSQGGVNKR